MFEPSTANPGLSEHSHNVEQLHRSWHDNAEAWTAVVRDGAIESRRVATDDAIVRAILARRPSRVLDLGCGEGWLVRELAEHQVDGVGVDGSAPLIDAASRAGGGTFVHLTYNEIMREPTRCGLGFDLVVANFSLFEERIEPLLRAIKRIMAGDAWFLLQTPHPIDVGPPYKNGWRMEDFGSFGDRTWTPMPWYFRTLGCWVTLLREFGFYMYGLNEPAHPETGQPLSLLLETQLADPW